MALYEEGVSIKSTAYYSEREAKDIQDSLYIMAWVYHGLRLP